MDEKVKELMGAVNFKDFFNAKYQIQKAKAVVRELCNGRVKWTMKVPATEEDPDIVIMRALTYGENAVKVARNLETWAKAESTAEQAGTDHGIMLDMVACIAQLVLDGSSPEEIKEHMEEMITKHDKSLSERNPGRVRTH